MKCQYAIRKPCSTNAVPPLFCGQEGSILLLHKWYFYEGVVRASNDNSARVWVVLGGARRGKLHARVPCGFGGVKLQRFARWENRD